MSKTDLHVVKVKHGTRMQWASVVVAASGHEFTAFGDDLVRTLNNALGQLVASVRSGDVRCPFCDVEHDTQPATQFVAEDGEHA